MRLNGLEILNRQKDINVDPLMIIDEMAKTSKRRFDINLSLFFVCCFIHNMMIIIFFLVYIIIKKFIQCIITV